MSDDATAVAAPVEAAPAPPPVVEEVATPVPVVEESTPEPRLVAPEKVGPALPPRSVRQQAREAMQERAKAAAEVFHAERTPGKVDEVGRTHAAEDGTYMEEGAAEAASIEHAEEESAAPDVVAKTPVTEELPPAAQAAGAELVTIPLDPRNPLADQGVTELTVPAHMERHIRTLVNSSVRQKEVQNSQAQLDQVRLDNARLAARVQALQDGTPETDPLQAEMLAQIKEHYPEQSAQVEAALAGEQAQVASQKEAEIYAGMQREQVARSFMEQVGTGAGHKYPAWASAGELQDRMASAMSQYGDYVDARNANLQRRGQAETMPTTDEFYGWVDTQYIRDPRVQSAVVKFRAEQQEKGRAQIAAEERKKLAGQEKATLSEAAARHAARPPSTPGISSQGTTPPPEDEGAARVSPGNRAKSLKAGIRERYRAAQGL